MNQIKYIHLFLFYTIGFQTITIAQDTISVTDSITSINIVKSETAHTFTDSLIIIGKTYLGLPYRTTTRAPWPLDCSGYVSMLFGNFGVSLPRSSGAIANVTQTISMKEAKPGDLIFFKGRDARKNRVGHVALIIEVSENSLKMMHSTVHKGIIIETYPDPYYYTRRFVKIGRVVL